MRAYSSNIVHFVNANAYGYECICVAKINEDTAQSNRFEYQGSLMQTLSNEAAIHPQLCFWESYSILRFIILKKKWH